MAQEKTVATSFRLTPRVKALLSAAAEHQRRSLTNTVEVLVEAYCEQHGLTPKGLENPAKPLERERK